MGSLTSRPTTRANFRAKVRVVAPEEQPTSTAVVPGSVVVEDAPVPAAARAARRNSSVSPTSTMRGICRDAVAHLRPLKFGDFRKLQKCLLPKCRANALAHAVQFELSTVVLRPISSP